MNFIDCYRQSSTILMEGALGERLKREFGLKVDPTLALATIIYQPNGKKALEKLWREYVKIAEDNNMPFIATTPTRRVNKDRINRSKYCEQIICDNVECLRQIKIKSKTDMFIGGLMGCKGDAYRATEVLTDKESKWFHGFEAELFRSAGVDFLFAGIMPAVSEAIGIAQAMENTGLPYIISFMIRKDGRLIDGTTIHDAISRIDYNTTTKPLCYMTNCVHPTILFNALSMDFNQTDLVKDRFHGIQSNTSSLSPEELDGSIELQCSDCLSLAKETMRLKQLIELKIVGGCCGTDSTHLQAVAKLIHKNRPQ